MKICIISFDNWGFNKYIANHLEQDGFKVTVINFNKYNYQYPNLLYRVYNGFLKTFFKQNLKTKFYGKCILEELEKNNEKQDLILTIKADFIAPEFAKQIKNYTKKSVAFFNDSTQRCPKIIKVLDCFDEVYSFDSKDCVKYNLKFKTNFIYTNNSFKKAENKIDLFNITSLDKRFKTILKIAKNLNANHINYKILVLKQKQNLYKINDATNLIEFIDKPIPLDQVQNYIYTSKVLLDVQRKHQTGLTFRVFESLGYEKKLITTNAEIKNYDFYNPNNICIIDAKNPIIDKNFFETPYQEIPKKILNKYYVSNWVKEFL